MSYSTKEVTQKYGISMHALRYYEKEGLLPHIQRDENGTRKYGDTDLEWLVLIRCMRAAGMSINYIRNYLNLCKEGRSTISQRKEIILLQKQILENQKRELDENLCVIERKLKCYEDLEGKGPSECADIRENAYAEMDELIQSKCREQRKQV